VDGSKTVPNKKTVRIRISKLRTLQPAILVAGAALKRVFQSNDRKTTFLTYNAETNNRGSSRTRLISQFNWWWGSRQQSRLAVHSGPTMTSLLSPPIMTVRSRSFQGGHTTFLAALDRSKWSMQKVFAFIPYRLCKAKRIYMRRSAVKVIKKHREKSEIQKLH
jgi:hypothetical protein